MLSFNFTHFFGQFPGSSHSNHFHDMHVSISTIASASSLTVKELSTVSPLPESYSFVDALSDTGVYIARDHNPEAVGRPAHSRNTLYLWESGCRTDGGWDCPASCTSAIKVWNSSDSVFTLQNCLVYPILAYSASQGWLVEEHSGLLEKYGIAPNDNVSFGDTKEHRYWPAIRDCRNEMCSDVLFPDNHRCPADAHGPYHATPLVHSIGPWQPHLVRWLGRVMSVFVSHANATVCRVLTFSSATVDRTLQILILEEQEYVKPT